MNTSQIESMAAAPVNPGETLRKAREANGWTQAEVAMQLRLKVDTLGHLEAGEFDRLPGHTFARGYVRSYANLLGLDPTQMVTAFDQYTGTDAKGSQVHSLGHIEQPMRLPQSVLRFASFVLLLAVVGGGLLWWQENSKPGAERSAIDLEHVEVDSADGTTQIHPLDEPQAPATTQGEPPIEPALPLSPAAPQEPGQALPQSEQPGASVPLAEAPETQAAPSTTESGPAAQVSESKPGETGTGTGTGTGSQTAGERAAVPPSATQPAPATPAAPAETAAAASEPAASALATGEGALNIRFTADCWVQVTDASGKVLLSGLKRAGDTVELQGKAPMSVRLGFARGAQLSYNGQPVDIAPFIRGETARLKVGS